MPSNTIPKTVILKASAGIIRKEAPLAASVDIKPGMLIERTSTGAVKPHAGAAGVHNGLFAVENEVVGTGIDTLYETTDDTVLFVAAPRGTEIYALLEASHAIAIGAVLESGASGCLQPVSAGFPVAVALEAISSVAEIQRIRVEVL